MMFMRNPGATVAFAAIIASLSGPALAAQPAAGNLNPAASPTVEAERTDYAPHFALNRHLAGIPSSVVIAPPMGLRPYIPADSREDRYDPSLIDRLERSMRSELEALIELKSY